MYQLYDINQKKFTEFDGSAATAALASGSYTVESDKDYNMISPDGRLVGISGVDVFDSISDGYRFAPDQVLQEQKQKQDDDERNLEAIALGAVTGPTFQLADIPLVKGLGIDPKELRRIREANPNWTLFSETASSLIASLMGGGAGLAASAAKTGVREGAKQVAKKGVGEGIKTALKYTPAGLVSRAAVQADRLALGKLAKKIPTESLLARGMIGGGVMGATGALENLVWEAGRLASEEAIGEVDLTSSAIMNNLQNAVLWGGILGSVGGFAFESIGQAAKNIAKKKPDLGLDIIDSALGVNKEAQKKFLLNPEGLETVRDADELALELNSRYNRVARIVEETGQDIKELEEAIKFQKQTLGARIKNSEDFFKEKRKELNNALETWKKDVKDVPVDPDIVDEVDNFVSGLNDRITEQSAISYKILGDADIDEVMTIKQFNKIFDDEIRNLSSEFGSISSREAKKIIPVLGEMKNDFNTAIKARGGRVSAVTVKDIIKAIDADSNQFYTRGSLDFSPVKGKALKSLRNTFDQSIKEIIPQYETQMKKVSGLMDLRSRLMGDFETKKAIEDRLKNLYKGLDRDYVKNLEDLADVYGARGDMNLKLRTLADRQLLAHKKLARYVNDSDYVPVIERWNPDLGKYQKSPTATSKLSLEEKSSRQLGARFFSDDLEKLKELSKDMEILKAARTRYGDVTSDVARKYLEDKIKWIADFEVSAKQGNLTKKGEVLMQAKENLAKLKRFSDVDRARTAVQSELSHADSKKVKEVFGFLSSISKPDEIRDFVSWVEYLRLRHIFNRRFTNGSKNVNLWSGIVRGAATLVGAVAGGGAGGLLGGAVGANIAGIVSGGLGYVLGSYIDRYGPRVALRILGRIAGVSGNLTPSKVTEAALEAFEFSKGNKEFIYTAAKGQEMMAKFNKRMVNKIHKSTRAFIELSVRGGIALSAVNRDRPSRGKSYRDLRVEVEAIEASKELYTEGVEDINDVLFPVMPNIMENFRQKNIRAADLVMQKFPKQPLSDIYDEWEPSVYELEKFKRFMDYTYKPELVFDEIKAGYISPEGVEVLKVIHPTLYRYLAESLTEEVLEKETYKKLSPSKRYQLAKQFHINPMDIYRHDKTMLYQNMSPPQVDENQQKQIAQQGKTERGQNAGQGTGNLKQTGLNSLSMDERNQTRLNKINVGV